MLLKNWLKQLDEIFFSLCWCHWNRLGVLGTGPMNQAATDPEALLAMSALLGSKDLRLIEIMGQWLGFYESLISIDRLKNVFNQIKKKYPIETKNALSILNNVLKENLPKSKLTRWKKFILSPQKKNNSKQKTITRKKLQRHDWILNHNLQLLLRYLFGPGSRADILYFALVLKTQKKNPFRLRLSSPILAQRLSYNPSTIYRTLSDFKEGSLIIENLKGTHQGTIDFELNPDYRLLSIKHIKEANNLTKKQGNLDTSYVDWFAVLEMVFLIKQSSESLKSISHSGIIKSRIFDLIQKLNVLLNQACVEVKIQRLPQEGLKGISQKKLMALVLEQCNQLFKFIIKVSR